MNFYPNFITKIISSMHIAKARKIRKFCGFFQGITADIHCEHKKTGAVLQLQGDENYSVPMKSCTSTGQFLTKLSMHHQDSLTGINITTREGMHGWQNVLRKAHNQQISMLVTSHPFLFCLALNSIGFFTHAKASIISSFLVA